MSDLAASVRARLLAESRARRVTFQSLLTRYAVERLLYRLSASPHRDRFVLKGAQLFAVWFGTPHRLTKDLDLAGFGACDEAALKAVFQDLATAAAPPDGLVFDAACVRVEPIREADRYGGRRVRLRARLGQAVIDVRVDVGLGDAVVPAPEWRVLPTILDLPAPRLRIYPREAVVAEKLQAMVVLGERNSRAKDFFDLWVLASVCHFDGGELARAVAATFERRATPVPDGLPTVLRSPDGGGPGDAGWRAFLGRLQQQTDVTWADVTRLLGEFVGPVLAALTAGEDLAASWEPGGPWR